MTSGPGQARRSSLRPLVGLCPWRVAGGVMMVTEGCAGHGAGRRGGAGPTPMGSGPSPPFPVHKETEGRELPPRAQSALPAPPLTQFLGGHLPFLHALSHTRDFPSSLSVDLQTVSGDCARAPRGARLKGEALAVQLGRCRSVRKGKWGFPSFAAWPHQGLSLRRGGGLVNSRAGFHPANEFSGSEAGARGQPRCSVSKPCKCCYLLFLALAPNIGVSFLPLPPLLFVLLGPWSCGSWRDCAHTTRASLSSLPSCSLALESSCPGRREAKCGGCGPQSRL